MEKDELSAVKDWWYEDNTLYLEIVPFRDMDITTYHCKELTAADIDKLLEKWQKVLDSLSRNII